MEPDSKVEAVGGGDLSAALDPLQLRRALSDLFDPRLVAADAPALLLEWAKVALGLSEVAFDERDKRFADPAWREHPLYRRLGQSYLIWERSLSSRADRQGGDWQRRARARYMANIITGALAPTNTLAGNPAALKRAFETGGVSLLRGSRNLLRDVVTNRGMPSMVDSRPYKVGENLATSAGAVVYREEMFEILQYQPTTAKVRERPLLMIPPELNRHYVLDLAPERSMVEFAVSRGIQTFMVVWRNPRKDKSAGHGRWSLEDYLAAHVRAIDVAREITRSDDINLLGLCAGGITSALTQAHLAANGGSPVNSCTYLVTMLDADLPNMATMLATSQVGGMLDKSAAKGKVLGGKTIRHNFAWMRPNDLVFSYLVNDWLLGNDPPAFDVLAWNDDATNMASAFERDSVALLSSGKHLSPGAVTLLGTPIDLSKVSCDNFAVAGRTDHITTWQPCYRTSLHLGGASEVVIVDSGHIQTFVNPVATSRWNHWYGPAKEPTAEEWLASATKAKGSWWPRWADWLLPRSGEERPAPQTLGSGQHPAVEPAPGRYVHEK